MKKSTSEIGIIVESTAEDFLKVMKEKSFSDVNYTKKALEIEYSRIELAKNHLLKKEQKDDEVVNLINELYVCMQRLEDKAKICVELMKEKRS